MAGALHRRPLRLLLAVHLGAAWALCMGLMLIFFASPVPPPMADRPDNGPTSFVDGDTLDIDPLLALAAVAFQAFHLSDIGACETVQRLLGCRDVLAIRRRT